MEFKIVEIKGQVLFKGEIITKMQKIWGENLLQNQQTNFNQTSY
jgi:predicted Ser/Thr protein kinase